MHGNSSTPDPTQIYDHWTQETLRYSDLDRMRHVNNVSTISLYEDGWARFVEDGGLGATDSRDWHVDYLGIDFRKELMYRDDVRVGTRISGLDGGRVQVGQVLLRNDTVVGVTERLLTSIDRSSGAPMKTSGDILKQAETAAAGPQTDLKAPFKATQPPPDPVAVYPLWRDDIFRFADRDVEEQIGRLTQLKLIESARVSLIQDVGAPAADPDVIWMAVHVALNFLAWPDVRGGARTGTHVDGFGRSSCRVRQTIYSDGQAIATGGAVVALANRKSKKTVEISSDLRERLENAPDSNVSQSERYNPAKNFLA
jgi:acyl-CoA thioester hydrolase